MVEPLHSGLWGLSPANSPQTYLEDNIQKKISFLFEKLFLIKL
jgi:hypothetical protein